MTDWIDHLRSDLARLEDDALLRTLIPTEPDADRASSVRREDQTLVNLASNDYLAIARDHALREAAIHAIHTHGLGAGASRLVSGHHPAHLELEARFASFKHAEAALLFPAGYMANLAVLTTLPRKGDLLCLDKLNHASLIDASRASAGQMRTYPHLNLDRLATLLQQHHHEHPDSQRFIVTDSVFSMDGDVADLPAICRLAEHHHAIPVIDEAHATGILGHTGAGLSEAQNVTDFIAARGIVISTASKALGVMGGLVTARRIVIDYLINRARSFIYTTAIAPPLAAAISTALDIIERQPHRRERLAHLSQRLRSAIAHMPSLASIDPSPGFTTPIIPVIVRTPEAALRLAAHLEKAGFLAPAIRPPTVPPNAARVRISLRADLEDHHLESLIAALATFTP